MMSGPPRRGATSEAYSFGEQLYAGLSGLVLVGVKMPQAWERVLQLQFGERLGAPPTRSLYCEVMARYSNVVLIDESDTIMACASQVGTAKSSLRLLQTGRRCELPPITSGVPPDIFSSRGETNQQAFEVI